MVVARVAKCQVATKALKAEGFAALTAAARNAEFRVAPRERSVLASAICMEAFVAALWKAVKRRIAATGIASHTEVDGDARSKAVHDLFARVTIARCIRTLQKVTRS